ncbi:uncharacterized protein LOC135371435 [Ornithodoros turicata]|uniref:uncharacterized protein LOC135371435 n=1 Tax=Ornithodoros turicata TaxID=34597 RepID=UPI003138D104
MPDDLDNLKRKRAGTRAAVTRTTAHLRGLLASATLSAEDVEVDLEYLIARRATFQEYDQQILAATSDDGYDEELNSVLEREQELDAAITRARRALRLASQAAGTAGTTGGSYATIHSCSSLAAIEKFKYLLSYVTDDDNYESAIAVLKRRFGRPDLLAAEHIDKLLSLRPVHSATEVGSLRNLYDDVSRHMRALEALSIPRSSYGVILYRVVTRCLPAELFVQFRQKGREAEVANRDPVCGDPPTRTSTMTQEGRETEAASSGDSPTRASTMSQDVDALLQFLAIQIEAREEAALHRHRPVHKDPENGDSVPLPSAAALPTATAPEKPVRDAQTSSPPAPCVLCRDTGHSVAACPAPTAPEDKRRRLLAARRCFRCAKRYHHARQYRSSASLTCGKCNGQHLTSLCDIQPSPRSNVSAVGIAEAISQDVQSMATSAQGIVTYLQTAVAEASGPAGTLWVRVLLDNGSQRTFVTEDLTRRVRVRSAGFRRSGDLFLRLDTTFCTSYVRKGQPLSQRTTRVPGLGRSHGPRDLQVPQPCSSGTVAALLQDHGLEPAPTSCPSDNVDNVDILVGADYYWRFVSGKIVRLSDDLTAVDTLFGWTVQGPANISSLVGVSSVVSLLCCAETGAVLDPTEMWRLDALGITAPASKDTGEADRILFEEDIKFQENRYEVPLMIKEPELPLEANNKITAERRLNAQLRRSRTAPDVLQQYDQTMREYFTEGHAEPVTGPDPPRNLYYLPHHAVISKDAVTTRIRTVFDASSHIPGQPSLNDVLSKGANINSDLLHLLLTFRSYPIILTADIRKAYLQIQIRPEDRDALRFLWLTELPSATNFHPECQEWRMTRVPFGASSSPFLLAATLHHHFEAVSDKYPATAARLRRSFYVDDLVIGCESVSEAVNLYSEIRKVLRDAGMEIRKWASNSSNLQHIFLKDGIAYDDVGCTDPVLRVLGVSWDRHSDTISARTDTVHHFATISQPTKRTLLQAFSRLYDSFGLLLPFTVTARLLFQMLWKERLAWDVPMGPTEQHTWWKWVHGLSLLSQVQVPRCAIQSRDCLLDLHLFADASPRAYGVVVYARTSVDSDIHSHILIAKSRVAPLKPVTIPRLELLGCLLAARIFSRIRNSLSFSVTRTIFWTDSLIALHWIKSEPSKWPQFVAARTEEIRQLTSPERWRHCDGAHNPADLLTRGLSAQDLIDSNAWWKGPPWLSNRIDHSASPEADLDSSLESELVCSPVATGGQDALIRLEDYSSLRRLLRITAYVLRYVANLRRPDAKRTGPLSAQELLSAERLWVERTQGETFATEIADLKNSRPLPRSSSILTLNPYLDTSSLLRVGGRLQQMEDTERVRHPILLPSKHRLTELLIMDRHMRLHHAGIQDTLCELRQSYWVTKGRQAVRRTLHTCLQCRRRRLSPETAPVAPLARERLTPSLPFDTVGVDFAGPLYVSREDGTEHKAYITLFTCGVTRAVHLELVSGMTTQHFLAAFRRFISRRGVPSLVIPPSPDVQDLAAHHHIQWKFILERAPWCGGWWERMVRSVKEALKRCLGRRRLNFEELTTALRQVESIINCRPLTHISSDPLDLEPLRPSHLLLGKRSTTLPGISPVAPPRDTRGLQRHLRTQEQTKQHFWARWRREYLLQMRSAHMAQSNPEAQLRLGDVVVIHDKGTPPMLWKLGRVTRLVLGRDGVIRGCGLTLANRSTIYRPVQLLHRVEADLGAPPAREGVE